MGGTPRFDGEHELEVAVKDLQGLARSRLVEDKIATLDAILSQSD